jgi:hypothetical protein
MNLVKKEEGRHFYVAKGMVEPSDEELLQPIVQLAAKQKLTIVKCIELHGTPEQKHCLKNMSMKNEEELGWLTRRNRNLPILYRIDDTHGRSITHQDLLPGGALQGMTMRCVVLGIGQEQSMYDGETTVHIKYPPKTPGCFMEKTAAGDHTGRRSELCAVMWVDLQVKSLMETNASRPTNTLGINKERGRRYKEKLVTQLDLTPDEKLLSLTDLVSSLSLKPNYDLYRKAMKNAKERRQKKRSLTMRDANALPVRAVSMQKSNPPHDSDDENTDPMSFF